MKILLPLCMAAGLAASGAARGAPDADAAQALLKKNDCLKCHSLDKKKSGPSYKEIAKKYKGKADSEDKLHKHLTSSPMVEVDGSKEEHKAIRTKDAGELKNVVQWILSL